MDTDLTYSDATKLAELIRNREVTSVEVVRAHLDRIDAINPKINAIVTWAAGALDAAVAADEALAAGAAVGPLHGVPFTVKDSIDTADVMTQRGSPIFKGRSPDADATSVARIRNAGGILIAKTNLPEFSYSTESDNLLTGRTNNPWNLDRTPGGPSGGGCRHRSGSQPFRSRHRPRHLSPRPGGTHRHRVPQAHPRPHPHDRSLAAGTASGLTRPTAMSRLRGASRPVALLLAHAPAALPTTRATLDDYSRCLKCWLQRHHFGSASPCFILALVIEPSV